MLTEIKPKTHNHQKNSRASLYPVSSLSLSRAPCLLEENELPVAEWQEYDKAFTCVRFPKEFRGFACFACFRRRHSKASTQETKEARPPPFPASLLCLYPQDARSGSYYDARMEFGSSKEVEREGEKVTGRHWSREKLSLPSLSERESSPPPRPSLSLSFSSR